MALLTSIIAVARDLEIKGIGTWAPFAARFSIPNWYSAPAAGIHHDSSDTLDNSLTAHAVGIFQEQLWPRSSTNAAPPLQS
jgi:hypothetical protein